jgi:phosphonate dehydrogenase
MTKPRILITHWVHDEVIARLSQPFEVIANQTRDTWPRERVLELARDCDAIIAFMPDRIDDAFLAHCPRLRVVAAALKGVDNFDVDACTRRGVWFTRIPDLLTVPTAELAIGLLLGVTRRMLEGDMHVRSGAFAGWRPQLYGMGLSGRTAGFIGLGAVGRAIVERLAGFDLRFLYTDPEPAPVDFEQWYELQRVQLAALLEASHFVFPLAHLTAETHHMIGEKELATMKRGAFLINVGRGSLVSENAVARSIASGHLGGYAADVFEMEDWALDNRPRGIPQALLHDRAHTAFTPHLGSAVDDVRRDIAMQAAENILDVFEGRRPRDAVNEPTRRAITLVGSQSTAGRIPPDSTRT